MHLNLQITFRPVFIKHYLDIQKILLKAVDDDEDLSGPLVHLTILMRESVKQIDTLCTHLNTAEKTFAKLIPIYMQAMQGFMLSITTNLFFKEHGVV